MRYHADGYTEEYLKGGEVTVAYNPEDVSYVWLFENGNYQIFDLIESRFRGKDMVEAEKLKADCNEMIKMHLPEIYRQKLIWQCIYRTLPVMQYIQRTRR